MARPCCSSDSVVILAPEDPDSGEDTVCRLAGPGRRGLDLARVAAVSGRIAADVDELARARRVQDLDTAAVLVRW